MGSLKYFGCVVVFCLVLSACGGGGGGSGSETESPGEPAADTITQEPGLVVEPETDLNPDPVNPESNTPDTASDTSPTALLQTFIPSTITTFGSDGSVLINTTNTFDPNEMVLRSLSIFPNIGDVDVLTSFNESGEQISFSASDTGVFISFETYTYENGLLVERQRGVRSTVPQFESSYSYDDQNRLIGIERIDIGTGDTVVTASRTYNASGWVTNRTSNNVSIQRTITLNSVGLVDTLEVDSFTVKYEYNDQWHLTRRVATDSAGAVSSIEEYGEYQEVSRPIQAPLQRGMAFDLLLF